MQFCAWPVSSQSERSITYWAHLATGASTCRDSQSDYNSFNIEYSRPVERSHPKHQFIDPALAQMTVHRGITQDHSAVSDIYRISDCKLPTSSNLLVPAASMIDYVTSHEQQHQQMMPSYPQEHQMQNDSYFGYNTTSSHQQGFQLNTSAPLSALHSMADIKASQSAPQSINCNSTYYSMKNLPLGTPHGISDILSRPDLLQLQAKLGQGMYYNSCSQPSQSNGGFSPNKDNNRSLYWSPNGQGLATGQSQWHSKHGKQTSLPLS